MNIPLVLLDKPFRDSFLIVSRLLVAANLRSF